MGVIAADRAAAGWTGQAHRRGHGDRAAEGRRDPRRRRRPRAAEALAGTAGVTEARALEPAKAYDLIRPWLGDVSDIEDLPVPRLVAVTLDEAPSGRRGQAASGPAVAERRRHRRRPLDLDQGHPPRRRGGEGAGDLGLPADRRRRRRDRCLRHPSGPGRPPRRGRGAALGGRRGRGDRPALPGPLRPDRGPGRA